MTRSWTIRAAVIAVNLILIFFNAYLTKELEHHRRRLIVLTAELEAAIEANRCLTMRRSSLK